MCRYTEKPITPATASKFVSHVSHRCFYRNQYYYNYFTYTIPFWPHDRKRNPVFLLELYFISWDIKSLSQVWLVYENQHCLTSTQLLLV